MATTVPPQFREAFSAIHTPIFVAGIDRLEKPRLTAHVKKAAAHSGLKRKLVLATSSALGHDIPCRIKTHSPRDLEKRPSLTAFVERFDHELIVHDPTEAFSRAKRLVRYGEILRAELKSALAGIYFSVSTRNIIIVLDASRYFKRGKVMISELNAAERTAYKALDIAYEGHLAQVPPVRIGFGMPDLALVPVDAASMPQKPVPLFQFRFKKPLAFGLAALGLAAGSTAAAQTTGPEQQSSAPAVSGTNFQIFGGYNDFNGDGGGTIGLNAATPFGESYGGQIDVAAGSGGETYYSFAGQLFWRNPDEGLLGLVVSHGDYDGIDVQRVGAKGELYYEEFTIAAQAGAQFSDEFGDGAYGVVDFRWYASDDFYVSAGGDFSDDVSAATIKTEFRPGFDAMPGLSFYGEMQFGDDDGESFFLAMKNHFYGTGTTKDRDRRDLATDESLAALKIASAMREKMGY